MMQLADFTKQVGQELYVSPWMDIRQERINAFAEATEDRQWIHVNPEKAAADSPWKTTVAHGFLTLSLIPHLMAGFTEKLKLKSMINYGLNHVRFTEAVRVNDRVRGRFKLVEAKELRGGMVKTVIELTVEIENRAKPALAAESVLLMTF
ncbi:MAG TPA: MaoC family dehydratase [Sphingomonadales bacterium]|nr:MaoC family dehydratase [Sphingomonadales bacterium]